jgi:bacterioferritin-associated ferredoxin
LHDFRIKLDMKIICRCEDVTEEEIVKKIHGGYRTIDDIKRILRVTMGLCQGKGCRKHIAKIISRELGIPMKEIVQPTYRPPTKPIPISATSSENSDK